MKLLLVLLFLTSCTTTRYIRVKPKHKTRQEIREKCFNDKFKLGMSVNDAIKACKFTLRR